MNLSDAQRAELELIAGGKTSLNGGGKLLLPDVPAPDDPAGLSAWLTAAFALDPTHPITGGVREGLAGPEGHVELRRAGAPPIRFEPAARLNAPHRLIEALSWRMLPTDGAVPALKSDHCRQIAYVVRMLCGTADTLTETDEAAGVIGTYLSAAAPVEGHTTYGTNAQRYEAAVALRRALDDTTGRPIGPLRYLLDENTGELVIRVADLAAAARMHIGSSLPRGWLDGRMQALTWTRIRLAGHSLPGRDGRRDGLHARCDAYRGHLQDDPDDDTNAS